MKKWDEGANTQMDDHHYESESKSKENESSLHLDISRKISLKK